MKHKRLAAMGLLVVMLFSLTACGGKDTGSSGEMQEGKAEEKTEKEEAGEIVNLTIHTRIGEQADQKAVFDALNEYTAEKIGVTADWVFHGGAYDDKINVIISSGEEYDACFTSNWSNSYTTNVAKGAFVDIKDILPKAAPKLLEVIPDYFWESATISGGIYAVPNQQIVARNLGITASDDFLEAAGASVGDFKNLKDCVDYAQKVYDEFGAKAASITVNEAVQYCGYECISDYLSAGVISMDDKEAKVVDFYETGEWLEMLNDLAMLSSKGLLDGETGYMPDYRINQNNAHKISISFGGTWKPGVEAEINSGGKSWTESMWTGDSPAYVSTSSVIATMFGISSTSKHVEETLKYLELVNTDPYVMNLLSFGIEGKHYNKVGDNVIELVPNSGYMHNSSWAFGNVFITYTQPNQPEDVWEQTKELNESATKSPLLGFSFDAEPVKQQIANVSNVVKEYETLVGGELPVEETNAAFIEKLKLAGVDDIISEMQSQVDAFMASK